jgi:hypothetical protein
MVFASKLQTITTKKRKRKNEFDKSPLQQCFFSQISGPTISYSLKFEMKLKILN